VGATARLYLVINVLQFFILDKMGVPFIVTAAVILLMILLYTFEGGVKNDCIYRHIADQFDDCRSDHLYYIYIKQPSPFNGEAFAQMKTKGYLNIF
jgi:hypothetical protein